MRKLENWKTHTWRLAAVSICALIGVQIYVSDDDKPAGQIRVASAISKAQAPMSRNPNQPDPKQGAQIDDIWKPAPTPAGGTSWSLLEAAKEVTRTDDAGYLISYPLFTREQRALEGKRIKVSGWMDPLQVGTKQKRFVLLGYPPGCPFHFHAKPMQFIEVMASTPFETDRSNVITVSGVLELTGYDESGVFYRLWDSRPA